MDELNNPTGPTSHPTPLKVVIGDFEFPQSTLSEFTLDESINENMVVRQAVGVITPQEGDRWDYRKPAHVEIYGDRRLNGLCTKATLDDDQSVTLELSGIHWIMEHSKITSLGTFGMSDLENLFWFQRIITPDIDVEVEGLTLDQSLRPFMYAVPLNGLTAPEHNDAILINDAAILSGPDDLIQPLLERLDKIHLPDYWEPQNPKIFGVVQAHDPIEAEALSIDRASRTLDLLNFACKFGTSHFVTRRQAALLPWEASAATAPISLHPCILVREFQSVKGWVRDLPGIEAIATADLSECLPKIRFIADQLSDAHNLGSGRSRQNPDILNERQQKLFGGIQRALRWLTISSHEHDLVDQFIASWTALESVLDAADYPGFFDRSRSSLRDALKKSLSQIEMPLPSDPLLAITTDMIEARLLQRQWPLRRKLSMFAAAFGIELKPSDDSTIGRLYSRRSSVFHSGQQPKNLAKNDVEYVQELVQRLVSAASIGAYQDIEPGDHTFQFGDIGPEGGAAPLFMDGEQVSYRWDFYYDQHGEQVSEFSIDGTIHRPRDITKKETLNLESPENL